MKKLLSLIIGLLFITSCGIGSLMKEEVSTTSACASINPVVLPYQVGYDHPFEVWNRTYGGKNGDNGYAIEATRDNGYIIVGDTSSFDVGGGDAWLIKIDDKGNEVWNRTYGGERTDYGFCGQQTSDGGYIITGGTKSYGAGDHDVWLIKTDGYGHELWNRTFGGEEWDQGYAVRQTRDGGYIIVGGTKSFGWGPNDYWLIKTDTNGGMEWNKTYGLHGYDWGYAVQQIDDDGYIITGATDTSLKGEHILDIGLIKTDSEGNTEWHKLFNYPFGGKRWDEGYGVQKTNDDGYIIAGIAHTYDWSESGEGDAWLIKTNNIGAQEWNLLLGGIKCDSFSSVHQIQDEEYIVSGWTYSYGSGNSDLWLLKISKEGKEVWDMTLGGSRGEWGLAHNLQKTPDGCYVIAGSTGSFGAGSSDAWVLKIREPTLVVNFQGGWGIHGVIRNGGTENFVGLSWSIRLDSPVIQGIHEEGIINSLPAGSEASLPFVPVSGVGPAIVRVTAGDIGRTARCFILGPFVFEVT